MVSLTLKEKILVAVLAASLCAGGMCFSIAVSFLPQSAFTKGLDSGDVGVILASFPIATILTTFTSNFLLPIIGTRKMLLACLAISTAALIPFAFVMRAGPGAPFYIACCVCRFFQGLGFAGIQISSTAITAGQFKDKLSFLIGILEMSIATGVALGPTIGGIVYDLVGFEAPFFIVASALGLLFIVSFFTVHPTYSYEKDETDNNKNSLSIGSLIKIPEIVIPGICVTSSLIDLTYMDVSLSPRVTEGLSGTVTEAGLIFAVFCVLYAISSPLIGWIIDKKGLHLILLLTGLTLSSIAFLFYGPIPFLNITPNIGWLIFSLVLIGSSGAMCYVPVLEIIIQIFERKGYANDAKSNRFATTTLLFFLNIGNLVGPLLGGYMIEIYGFQQASLVFFIKSLSLAIIVAIYAFYVSQRKEKHLDEKKLLLP